MNKKRYLIVIIPFFMILIFFLVEGIIINDTEYSKEESRNLKVYEDINLENKDFITKPIEDYVVDQFPDRPYFLKAYSLKDKYLNKRFTRDLYVSKDNWLFVETSKQEMNNIAKALGNIVNDYGNKQFYYAIVPTKNMALKEKYSFTKNDVSEINYKNLLNNLDKIDKENFKIIDVIKKDSDSKKLDDEDKWYKSDFHWNALGAKLAGDYIIESLIENQEIETFYDGNNISEIYLDNKTYKGDLNKRFSDIYLVDEIPVVLDLKNIEGYKYFTSENDTSEVSRKDIISRGINEDILNYSELYTPNLSYYRVENKYATNDKSILIIKDSMQNAMIDIFTETFTQVRVVDPRLKQKYKIDELILSSDIVLLLFHQSNDSEAVMKYLMN